MDNAITQEARPFGQLGIIAMKGAADIGRRVDETICTRRKANEKQPDSFLIPQEEIRFSNGEGKVKISETVRGKDVYILCDVGNYSCTYNMYGFTTHMGPDEHFQDLKRTLSAIGGKSRRTTVIMPMLYASRQHRRKSRESLDCAMALQELERMDVKMILTFDVHDPNIQNAIPLVSFENIYPTFDIVRALIESEPGFVVDRDKLIVISPDTGAMDRGIYYSGVLGVDVGLFFKRRDRTKVVGGKNPIVAHEYMGRPIAGMDALIVDDMIASGESVLDIAAELKLRQAGHIYIASTFALFTEGYAKFDEFYRKGIISRVYSTNLTYVPPAVQAAPWFCEVDMANYLARLIDYLNYDLSVAQLLDASQEIRTLLHEKSTRTAQTD